MLSASFVRTRESSKPVILLPAMECPSRAGSLLSKGWLSSSGRPNRAILPTPWWLYIFYAFAVLFYADPPGVLNVFAWQSG